jgi:cell pole-organizing protein PopZ
MSDAKGQQEPSMEEILASIRRIIAEDSDAAKPPIEVEAAALPPDEDEVLELTEVADEPAPYAAPEPEPEPYRPAPPPPPAPRPRKPEAPVAFDADEPLVSASPAAASSAAFAEVTARLRERRSGEMFLGNGAVTLEEIVRELLKPMLREWLDANLPPLVERLVHEEIKRLARDAV